MIVCASASGDGEADEALRLGVNDIDSAPADGAGTDRWRRRPVLRLVRWTLHQCDVPTPHGRILRIGPPENANDNRPILLRMLTAVQTNITSARTCFKPKKNWNSGLEEEVWSGKKWLYALLYFVYSRRQGDLQQNHVAKGAWPGLPSRIHHVTTSHSNSSPYFVRSS